MTRQVISAPSGTRVALAAYVRQIEQTQWAPADEIVRSQHRELVLLARHAAANSAPFRDRLAAAGLTPDDLAMPEGLRRLPVMRRRTLQALGERLFCTELPRDHQPVFETRTSGSTGEPVVVRRTRIGQRDWMAMTVRDHLWHGRDHTKRTSLVRATNSEYRVVPSWGAPMAHLFKTGPAQYIPITADLDRQWAWLADFEPDTLLIYPSTLEALAQRAQARGETLPGLSHIWTIGETLSPATRALAAAAFGPTPVDLYSSQEIGIIALQCPHSGLYHVAAEVSWSRS